MVGVKTLPEHFVQIGSLRNGDAVALEKISTISSTITKAKTETADFDAPHRFRWLWNYRTGIPVGTITRALTSKGKSRCSLVNEPISDDPKFFKGKALTYYGRWNLQI